jgi:phytoene synthase
VSLSPIAAFARAHDPDRFLAALFAPPERREAIFTLIAFNHELARAREAASHPMAALIRLQWWRDALEEARQGKPARRHEVAEPLHAAITAGALDAAALDAMIDAREAEAEEAGILTEADFVTWLRGTAGGFAYAAGLALGGSAELPQKNPFLVALGERTRALRARRGMTRKAVAVAAGSLTQALGTRTRLERPIRLAMLPSGKDCSTTPRSAMK